MKRSISLLGTLILSTTLFWGVSAVEADEILYKVSADATSYCNLRFPTMLDASLSWERPVLDPNSGNIVAFYGPCDHDPVGRDEIRAQTRVLMRGDFEDGE